MTTTGDYWVTGDSWGVRGHVAQWRPQTRGLFGCGGLELRPFPTHTCFRRPALALLKQVWVGLRPVGSADKSGAAEERWLGTEVDSRLSTAQARWLGAMSGRR